MTLPCSLSSHIAAETSRLTLAPRFANSKAIPAPIPRDAPVTMATLLLSECGEDAEDISRKMREKVALSGGYYSSCVKNMLCFGDAGKRARFFL